MTFKYFYLLFSETVAEYVRQNSCFGKKKYNFQLFCNISVKTTAFLKQKRISKYLYLKFNNYVTNF